jgi:hypothetical protein
VGTTCYIHDITLDSYLDFTLNSMADMDVDPPAASEKKKDESKEGKKRFEVKKVNHPMVSQMGYLFARTVERSVPVGMGYRCRQLRHL